MRGNFKQHIGDDETYGEEFQRSMDVQFKGKHQAKILETFIERSFISGSNLYQNSLPSTRKTPVSNPNVRLPKMELKKFSSDPPLNGVNVLSVMKQPYIKTLKSQILKKWIT